MAQTGVLIADFQCFVDSVGGYIVKELSLLDYNFQSVRHWIFKPPVQHKQCEKSRRTNYWLENYYHKIKWNDGDIEYEMIRDIFKFIDCNYKFVFVKGYEKKRFLLQNLYSCCVINLEDYDCPKLDSLETAGNQCIIHNTCKEKCT